MMMQCHVFLENLLSNLKWRHSTEYLQEPKRTRIQHKEMTLTLTAGRLKMIRRSSLSDIGEEQKMWRSKGSHLLLRLSAVPSWKRIVWWIAMTCCPHIGGSGVYVPEDGVHIADTVCSDRWRILGKDTGVYGPDRGTEVGVSTNLVQSWRGVGAGTVLTKVLRV